MSGCACGVKTLLSTIFQIYRSGQRYWKPDYPEKMTDLSQVTNIMYPEHSPERDSNSHVSGDRH